jgi:hypothetical protein
MYVCVCVCIYIHIYIVNYINHIAICLLYMCPDTTRAGDERGDGAAPAQRASVYACIYILSVCVLILVYGRR